MRPINSILFAALIGSFIAMIGATPIEEGSLAGSIARRQGGDTGGATTSAGDAGHVAATATVGGDTTTTAGDAGDATATA